MVVIPEYHIKGQDSGQIFTDLRQQTAASIERIALPDPAGETEIIKILLESGYNVVDRHQVNKIRYSKQIKAILDGNTEVARQLGVQHGADVMLVGEAISESTGNPFRGLVSCRARVEARMIKLDTGRIIFADGRHASGIDRSEAVAGKKAIQQASVALGATCVDQLEALNVEVTESAVYLVVTGLKYKEFLIFEEQVLDSVDCIGKVDERSYVDQRATLRVNTTCDSRSLSRALLSKDETAYGIEVVELSTSELVINVIKKVN
jgi:hypothetical protein